MHVFLNGRIVPEDEAVVSVFDRSFQLGDGLFETIRILNSRPFRWDHHLDRLENGAAFLGVKLPFARDELRVWLRELATMNNLPDAILRLHLSRGVGRRGYSPAGADRPVCVMSLHPAPSARTHEPVQWNVITSSLRLPAPSPLARFKTSDKLTQTMARAEADAAGVDEAIMLDAAGNALEGSAGNLLWVEDNGVYCVPSDQGALPGVTQSVMLEICRKQSIPVVEELASLESVRSSDGCFLTLTPVGMAEIIEWDNQRTNRSPITRRLFECYQELLHEECATD